MTQDELQDWLVNDGLKAELATLRAHTALLELTNVVASGGLEARLSRLDWDRLMLAGSVLGRSQKREHQEAVLRIATAAMTLPLEAPYRDAAAVLFDKVANHRAVMLAESRGHLPDGWRRRLGVSARMEATRRALAGSVLVESSGELLRVNDFQSKFWRGAMGPADWISASAPTASGKTYLVLHWLLDWMHSKRATTAIYLAPTRALVSEIESNLNALINELNIDGLSVTSLPIASKFSSPMAGGSGVVGVFTQERLHLLANVVPGLHVDLLVVDEAHKVGDRQRGVILQDAVERISRQNAGMKAIFISPATQNPGALLEDAPSDAKQEPIDSDVPTVLQNVIFATQVPRKPTEWELVQRHGDAMEPLGILKLPTAPGTNKKKLAFIASAIGERGGTLVYVNGAREAEDVAFLLMQKQPRPKEIDPDLAALADLSRKGVHEKYLLASVVERGVAFHYGNMPSLLRNEIERLFRIGKIRFLVCTSTLIEGVNLSCRNIVLRGPRKGLGKPMEPHDFWNLAGRAGRWGDEFQGSIICIEPHKIDAWPNGVPARTRHPIRRETDVVLDQPQELLGFLDRRSEMSPRALSQNAQFEQVSGYLLSTYLREGSITDAPFAKRHDPFALALLQKSVGDLAKSIDLPDDLIARHSGVSPLGLQKLLAYFEKSSNVENLLPAPVESDDAYQRLIAMMSRVNSHMYGAFLPEARVPLDALVVVEWLQGMSLARIIKARIKYNEEKKRPYKIADLILSTMKLVEQTARFAAPKFLAAYMDVLKLHLERIGRQDLIPDGLEMGLALEFGISNVTLLNLMELGLSRMSAVALYEKMADDNLDLEGCRDWIAEHIDQFDGMDIPTIIVREIRSRVPVENGSPPAVEAEAIEE
ncbi:MULTISPECIES: DEAD/DEAH box helicase [unclassified Brevundimonas]|uniref:DEAD/DEAH box helicase n=1 Tax=unclassified Brevundimonas TaxID=2622653 RepID=UPI0025C351B1|nr:MULTISPECIES: DEAD/DEAH box helicase [unclassified Brevundimonas]